MTQATKTHLPVGSRFIPTPAAQKMATTYEALADNPSLLGVAALPTPAVYNEGRSNEAALMAALSSSGGTAVAPPWLGTIAADAPPSPTAAAFELFEGPQTNMITLQDLWGGVGIRKIAPADLAALERFLTPEFLAGLAADPTPAMLVALGLAPSATAQDAQEILLVATPLEMAAFLNAANPLLNPKKNLWAGRKHGRMRIFDPGDPDWHPAGQLTPLMLDALGLPLDASPEDVRKALASIGTAQLLTLDVSPDMLAALGLPIDASNEDVQAALAAADAEKLDAFVAAINPSPQSGMWGNPFDGGNILTAAQRLHDSPISPSGAEQIAADLYMLYILNNKFLLKQILAGALEGKTLIVPVNVMLAADNVNHAMILAQVAALPPAQLQGLIDNLPSDDAQAADLVAQYLRSYMDWTQPLLDARQVREFLGKPDLDEMLDELPGLVHLTEIELDNLRMIVARMPKGGESDEARSLMADMLLYQQRPRAGTLDTGGLPNRALPDFPSLAPDASAVELPVGSPSPAAQRITDDFLMPLLAEAGHGEGAWLHDQAMPIIANLLADPSMRELNAEQLADLLDQNLRQLAHDTGYPGAYAQRIHDASGWLAVQAERAGLLRPVAPLPGADVPELPNIEALPKLQDALRIANEHRLLAGQPPFETAYQLLLSIRDEPSTASRKAIADLLGVSAPTVKNWLTRLEEYEGARPGLNDAAAVTSVGVPTAIIVPADELSPIAPAMGTTVTKLHDHADWERNGVPPEQAVYVGRDRSITAGMLRTETIRLQSLLTEDSPEAELLRRRHADYMAAHPGGSLADFVKAEMGKWGNPYHDNGQDRSEHVESYALYVMNDRVLLQAILDGELDGKQLICFCNEAHTASELLVDYCHANVLARLANMPRQDVQAMVAALDQAALADPQAYARMQNAFANARNDPRTFGGLLVNATPPWAGTTTPERFGPPEPGDMRTPNDAGALSRYMKDGVLVLPDNAVYIDDATSAARYGWTVSGRWANVFLNASPLSPSINEKPEIVNQMYTWYVLNNPDLLRALADGELDGTTLVGLQAGNATHAQALQRLISYDRPTLRAMADHLDQWLIDDPERATILRQALAAPGLDLRELAARGALPNDLPNDLAHTYAALIAMPDAPPPVENTTIQRAVERAAIIRQGVAFSPQTIIATAAQDIDQVNLLEYDYHGRYVATPNAVALGVVDIRNSTGYKAFMSRNGVNGIPGLRDEVLAVGALREQARLDGQPLAPKDVAKKYVVTGNARVFLDGEAYELYELDQQRRRTTLENDNDAEAINDLLHRPPGRQAGDPTADMTRQDMLRWYAIWKPDALQAMSDVTERELLEATQGVRDTLVRMSDTYVGAGYRYNRLHSDRIKDYLLSDDQLGQLAPEAEALAQADVQDGELPEVDAAGVIRDRAKDARGNALRQTDVYKAALSRLLNANVTDPDYRRPANDPLRIELLRAEARELGRLDAIGRTPDAPDALSQARADYFRTQSTGYRDSRKDHTVRSNLTAILTNDERTLTYKEKVIRLLVQTGNLTVVKPGPELDKALAGAKYPLLDPALIGADAQWIILSIDATTADLLPAGFGALAPDVQPTLEINKDGRRQFLYVTTQNENGETVPMSHEEYLRRTHRIVHVDAGMGRTSKRLNRETRPLQRAEHLPREQVILGIIGEPGFEYEKYGIDEGSARANEDMVEAIWDGSAVISREAVMNFPVPPGLTPEELAEYNHDRQNCYRWEFTITTERGQVKGHALVSDEPLANGATLITRNDFKSEIKMTPESMLTFMTIAPVHEHDRLKIDIQTLVNVFEFYGEDDLKRFIEMDAEEFMEAFVSGRVGRGMSRFEANDRLEDVRKWYVTEFAARGGDPRDFAGIMHSVVGQWVKRNHYDDEGKFSVLLPGAVAGHVTPASVARLAGWDKECPADQAVYDKRFGWIIGDKAWGIALNDAKPKPVWTTIIVKAGDLPELSHDEALGGRPLQDADGQPLLDRTGKPRGYVTLTDQWDSLTPDERRWAVSEIWFLYKDRKLDGEAMPAWAHVQAADETTVAYHARQTNVTSEEIAHALRALDVHDKTAGLNTKRWQRVRTMDGERQAYTVASMKSVAGGGDGDDNLNGQVITDPGTGQRHVVIWRNPNQEGEVTVLQVAPDSEIPQTRVKPRRAYDSAEHERHKEAVWQPSAELAATKDRQTLVAEYERAQSHLEASAAAIHEVVEPSAEDWAIAERHDALRRSQAYMNVHNRFHNGIDAGSEEQRRERTHPASTAIEREMAALERDHAPAIDAYRLYKDYRQAKIEMEVAQALAITDDPAQIHLHARAEHDAMRDALSLPPDLRKRELDGLNDVRRQLDEGAKATRDARRTLSMLDLQTDLLHDQSLIGGDPRRARAYQTAYLNGIADEDRLTDYAAQGALQDSERNTERVVGLYQVAHAGIQEDHARMQTIRMVDQTHRDAYAAAFLQGLDNPRVLSDELAREVIEADSTDESTLTENLTARAWARASQLPMDVREEHRQAIQADPRTWFEQYVANASLVQEYETLRRIERRALLRGRTVGDDLRQEVYEATNALPSDEWHARLVATTAEQVERQRAVQTSAIERAGQNASPAGLARQLDASVRRASTELRDLAYYARPPEQRDALRGAFLDGLGADERLTPDEAKATLRHLGERLSQHASAQPAANAPQGDYDAWVADRTTLEAEMNRVHGLSVPEHERQADLAYFSDSAYHERLIALNQPAETDIGTQWQQKTLARRREDLQRTVLSDRTSADRVKRLIPPNAERLDALSERAKRQVARAEFYHDLSNQLVSAPLDSARSLNLWRGHLTARTRGSNDPTSEMRRLRIEEQLEAPNARLAELDERLKDKSASTMRRHASERAALVQNILDLQAEATALKLTPGEARRELDYLDGEFDLAGRTRRLTDLEGRTARYVKSGAAYTDILSDLQTRSEQAERQAETLHEQHDRLATTRVRLTAYERALSMDQIDADLVDVRLARYGGAFSAEDRTARVEEVTSARRELERYESDTATVIQAPRRSLKTLPQRIDETPTRFEYEPKPPVKIKGRAWDDAVRDSARTVKESAGVLEQVINVGMSQRTALGPVSTDPHAIIKEFAKLENAIDTAQKEQGDMSAFKRGAEVKMAHLLTTPGVRFPRAARKRLMQVPDEVWAAEGLKRTEPQFYGRVNGQPEAPLDRVDEKRYEVTRKVQQWNANMQRQAVPPIELFAAVSDLDRLERQQLTVRLQQALVAEQQRLDAQRRLPEGRRDPTRIQKLEESVESHKRWIAAGRVESAQAKRPKAASDQSEYDKEMYSTYMDTSRLTISQLGAAANSAYFKIQQNVKTERKRGLPISRTEELAAIDRIQDRQKREAAKKNPGQPFVPMQPSPKNIEKDILRRRVQEDQTPFSDLEQDEIRALMDTWLRDHSGTGDEPRPPGYEITDSDIRRTLQDRATAQVAPPDAISNQYAVQIKKDRFRPDLRPRLDEYEQTRQRLIARNPTVSEQEVEKRLLERQDDTLASYVNRAQMQLAAKRAQAHVAKSPEYVHELARRLPLNDPELVERVLEHYVKADSRRDLSEREQERRGQMLQQWLVENPNPIAEIDLTDARQNAEIRRETQLRMRREEIAAASLVTTYTRRREADADEEDNPRIIHEGWVWTGGGIDPITKQQRPGNATRTMDALSRFVPSIGTLEQTREGIVLRRDHGPQLQTRVSITIPAADINLARARGQVVNRPYTMDTTPSDGGNISTIKTAIARELDAKLIAWGHEQRPAIIRREFVPHRYETLAELAITDAELHDALPADYHKRYARPPAKNDDKASFVATRNALLREGLERVRQNHERRQQEQADRPPPTTPEHYEALAADADALRHVDPAAWEALGARPRAAARREAWQVQRNALLDQALDGQRQERERQELDWKRRYMDQRAVTYVLGDEDWALVKDNPEAWQDADAYVQRGYYLGAINAEVQDQALPPSQDQILVQVGFANNSSEMHMVLLKKNELDADQRAELADIARQEYETRFGQIDDLIAD